MHHTISLSAPDQIKHTISPSAPYQIKHTHSHSSINTISKLSLVQQELKFVKKFMRQGDIVLGQHRKKHRHENKTNYFGIVILWFLTASLTRKGCITSVFKCLS